MTPMAEDIDATSKPRRLGSHQRPHPLFGHGSRIQVSIRDDVCDSLLGINEASPVHRRKFIPRMG